MTEANEDDEEGYRSEVSSQALMATEPKEAATSPDKLLKSSAVRNRLGDISSQTLWRYGRDPELEFPKPIYIYGTRYWVSGEIDDFIERQRGDE